MACGSTNSINNLKYNLLDKKVVSDNLGRIHPSKLEELKKIATDIKSVAINKLGEEGYNNLVERYKKFKGREPYFIGADPHSFIKIDNTFFSLYNQEIALQEIEDFLQEDRKFKEYKTKPKYELTRQGNRIYIKYNSKNPNIGNAKNSYQLYHSVVGYSQKTNKRIGKTKFLGLAEKLYRLKEEGLIEVKLDESNGKGNYSLTYIRPVIQANIPLNIVSEVKIKDEMAQHLLEAVKLNKYTITKEYVDNLLELNENYDNEYYELQDLLAKLEEVVEREGIDTDNHISMEDYYKNEVLSTKYNNLLQDIYDKEASLSVLKDGISEISYLLEGEDNLSFSPVLTDDTENNTENNVENKKPEKRPLFRKPELKPQKENYKEAKKYYEEQIANLNIKIRNLDKRLNMPYTDKKSVVKEISLLEARRDSYENTIEQLNNYSITGLFGSLEKEIDTLIKDIEDYNLDLNMRDKIEFLNLIIKGTGRFNSREDFGIESLAKIHSQWHDKLSRKVDELNLLYTKSLPSIGRQIVTQDINFINNLEDELTDEEYEALFEADKDIDTFSKHTLGITQSFTRDTILPQILKSLLDTAKTEYDAIPKKMKDNLVKAAKALGDNHDYNWMFEKSKYGIDTGNIINFYSYEFLDALRVYRAIPNRADLQDGGREEKVRAQLNWLKGNVDIVDIRKLRWVKDLFKDDAYHNYHFNDITDEEMDKYEAYLKDIYGPAYEREMSKLRNKLEVLAKKTVQVYATDDVQMKEDFEASNPFEFVKNFYSGYTQISFPIEIQTKEGQFIEKNVYYNTNLDNLFIIPKSKREIVNPLGGVSYEETNYFNKDFKKLLLDDKKKAYWEAISTLYQDYINPTYGKSNLASMSYGKMEEDFWNIVVNANGFTKLGKGFTQIKNLLGSGFFLNQSGKQDNGVYSNYTDIGDVRRMALVDSYNTLSEKELRKRLKEKNINIEKGVSKRILVRELANSEALKGFSKDLNKVTLALTDLASLHAARQDVLPKAEMLLEYQKSITDKEGRMRTNSITKMQYYIDTIIRNQGFLDTSKKLEDTELYKDMSNKFGKYILEKFNINLSRSLSEADKQAKELFEKALKSNIIPEDTSFSYQGYYYKSKINKKGQISYTKFSPKRGIQPVTPEDFRDLYKEYLTFRINSLGVPMTASSTIIGLQRLMIMRQMSFGFEGGFKNRVEGKNTNWRMDATGLFWTKGNMEVAENHLFGSNLKTLWERLAPNVQAKALDQHKILRLLIEELDVIQDKKSEMDKQNSVNNRDYGKILNPYQFAIDNPEFKNQAAIVLSILMDTEIEDKYGKKHKVFDKDKSELVPYKIVDGNLVLKEEFDTEKNRITWGQFGVDRVDTKNNGYLLTRAKIKNAISRSQGNYEGTDTQMILNNVVGRVASAYKRWLPEHVYQRFNTNTQVDLITGKRKSEGSYVKVAQHMGSLVASGTVLTAIQLGLTPSLGGFVGMAGIGTLALMYWNKKNNTNIDSDVKQLMVFTEQLKSILKASLNFPLRMFHLPAGFRLDDSISTEKTGLTQEDANLLASAARELALGINMMLLKIIFMSFFWDPEDKKKKAQANFYDNLFTSLLETNTMYTDPKKFLEDTTRWALIKQVDDIQKVGKTLLSDKPFSEAGDQFFKAIAPPSIYKLATGSSLIENPRDYKPGEWSEHIAKGFKDPDYKAKRKIKELTEEGKEDIREELIEEGYEEGIPEFDKELSRRFNKIFGRKNKYESYEDRLEKIEIIFKEEEEKENNEENENSEE